MGEAAAMGTASTFMSGINHSMAYQIAGKLLMTMEGLVVMEVSHPDVVTVLTELDVQAAVSTVKALLEDLKPVSSKCGSTIKVCIDNLHQSMTAIQTELELVEQTCSEHNQSWWSYVYTNPDVTPQLNRIKSLKGILDGRINLLTKAATIELQLISHNAKQKR